MKVIIENDMLIRRVPIEYGVNHTTYRNDCIISKEEFIACYNAWIKEADNE